MSDKKLEGKVALVAGGSRNLGREISKLLSSEGPIVKFLVAEGHWITGQIIFANGGYTTR